MEPSHAQEAKESSSELSAGPSYQPTAANNNFEANSAIHGGQIALKAGRHPGRPTITNRRVSSKGRHHIPTAIHTGQDQGGIPGIPQLPTPMTGYLDQPLHSPISPRGAPGSRGMSHPPQSPANRGMHQMQQQQAMGGPGQQNYAEMLQRAEMDHLHQQQYGGGGGSGGQGYDSMYGSVSQSVSLLDTHERLRANSPLRFSLLTSSSPRQQVCLNTVWACTRTTPTRTLRTTSQHHSLTTLITPSRAIRCLDSATCSLSLRNQSTRTTTGSTRDDRALIEKVSTPVCFLTRVGLVR